jgi:thiamine transport system ATP-binding protein
MEILRTEGLTAGYGTSPAVISAVDLDVRQGEIVALLGASGSGKSTLLRCVAGLHPLRSGRVMLGGEDVDGLAVERRGIGLVFQDHALFPHRDVTGNVAFGPRMQGLDRATIAQRVATALESVGIAHLRDRAIDELSGGEQQRVALARALASQPRLLLLDEPYGSLDRPLRERLIAELPALVRGADRGAVLVTHDQQEALRVADRIAVLVGGTLRQLDTPDRIWAAPVDAEVAAFLDVGPVLAAEVSSGTARGAFGVVPTPDVPDGAVRLLVPHTALSVITSSPGREADRDTHRPSGRLEARIGDVRFAGDHHRIEVVLGDGTRVVLRDVGVPTIADPGAPVTLALDIAAVRVLPAQGAEHGRLGTPGAAGRSQ